MNLLLTPAAPRTGSTDDLVAELSLGDSVKQRASSLHNSLAGHLEPKVLVRCCVYLASPHCFNITPLLRGHVTLGEFVAGVKSLLGLIQLPEAAVGAVQGSLQRMVRSQQFFKKFKKTWEKLFIDGRQEKVSCAYRACWGLFVVAKAQLLGSSSTLCDGGYLLAAVLHVALSNLPSGLEYESEDCLGGVCALLKTQVGETQVWVDKVQGVFTAAGGVLSRAIQDYYYANIEISDLDEMTLLEAESAAGTPAKNSPCFNRVVNARVLKWDNLPSDLNLNSRISELHIPPQSPFLGMSTPMTMAMEILHWLNDLNDEHGTEAAFRAACESVGTNFFDSVSSTLQGLVEQLERLFTAHGVGTVTANSSSFILQHFEDTGHQPNAQPPENYRVTEVAQLFRRVVQQLALVGHPKLQGSTFCRALFACCIETSLYIHENLAISLLKVLEVCKIRAFDMWKVINPFLQFDSRTPIPLKWHFREIETKILSCLGWVDAALVEAAASVLNNPTGSTVSYANFFKRALTYAAHRTLETCRDLGLPEHLHEASWTVFKYLFAHKTELLRSRNIDQMVLCCIFAACKIQSEVRFQDIILSYRRVFQEDDSVYLKVHITGTQTGDLVLFYNKVFIAVMKDFLLSMHNGEVTANMYPGQSLYSCAPAVQKPLFNPNKSAIASPFMTPRTKKLLAVTSPLLPVNPLNPCGALRRMSFEQPMPPKKFKNSPLIFQTPEQQDSIPFIKRD